MNSHKPQIFLIHFAGGNVYSYKFLEPYLQGFEIIPVELPGRGQRIGEPLIEDLATAAADICRQIESKLSRNPFVLYGHSLGASLALQVAHALISKGKSPVQLVVTGNSGPGRQKHRDIRAMDQKTFLGLVTKLGGLPEEFLADPDLIAFFEPILRVDIAIADMRNDLDGLPALRIPIVACMGTEEEDARGIENWSRFTSGSFESVLMKGNHFFIFEHAAALGRLITEGYQKYIKEEQHSIAGN